MLTAEEDGTGLGNVNLQNEAWLSLMAKGSDGAPYLGSLGALVLLLIQTFERVGPAERKNGTF